MLACATFRPGRPHLPPPHTHPDRDELPLDFWSRVRPSPLVATLSLNMVKAARKADGEGRAYDAAAKYGKAARYLEHSSGHYEGDQEMREWTQNLLRECCEHAEATSLGIGPQLAPSSRYLLHQHYGSWNAKAALLGGLKPTAASKQKV
jgi:hypothetical protein